MVSSKVQGNSLWHPKCKDESPKIMNVNDPLSCIKSWIIFVCKQETTFLQGLSILKLISRLVDWDGCNE